jgi:uncharacterized membrane protein
MADLEGVARELGELRQLLSDLTGRVYRIERSLKLESAVPPSAATTRPPSPAPQSPPASPSPPSRLPDTPSALLPTKMPDTDLESRIGSHWLNRIGIAAVLIGVSYFLKYAFDNNWIGAAGRVTIGLLAGIAVIVWSERFRGRGYRIFSFSLKAVGIGVLYLSLWAAFQLYSLVPSGVAFVAMLLVTSATAVMALTQDAEILAAFALAGGFTTPFLLSTGQNRELQLFSYLVLLDIATLALVIFKPWRRLLLLSFAGTLLLYIGWYSSFYDRSQFRLTVAFATLFFAIFTIAALAGDRSPRSDARFFSLVPHVIAFLNAVVYFLQLYTMLEQFDKTVSAWCALALAAVYIFLSRQVHARYADAAAAQNLHFLHLALAIGFITIAVPIRLDTHWITIGWLVESAVLLWVADRVKSDFLNAFAVIALVLGIARLLFVDNFYSTVLIFNARMAAHGVAIAVLAMIAWYGSRRDDEQAKRVAAIAVVGLNILALVAFSREITDYYSRQLAATYSQPGRWNPADWTTTRNIEIARDFTYSAVWMAYGAVLMIVGFWKRSAFVRWQALILIAVTIVKVFVYDVSQLDRGYRIVSFIVLGALLLAISFAYQRDWLKLSNRKSGSVA